MPVWQKAAPSKTKISPSCLLCKRQTLSAKGDEGILFSAFFRRPYGLFVLAAVLAALLCLFPVSADAPEDDDPALRAAGPTPEALLGVPAGADLSERTAPGCMLHQTLCYAPCGHSVQHRVALPAALVGLSRQALEKEIGDVIPGATVTGFSASEVDVSRSLGIPCPLHWVLRAGEDGMLQVMQNTTGEALTAVRGSDVPLALAPQEDRAQLLADGLVFDDVQALEGYLESLSS